MLEIVIYVGVHAHYVRHMIGNVQHVWTGMGLVQPALPVTNAPWTSA